METTTLCITSTQIQPCSPQTQVNYSTIVPIAPVRLLLCGGGRQLLLGAADSTRKLLQFLHRLDKNTQKYDTGERRK